MYIHRVLVPEGMFDDLSSNKNHFTSPLTDCLPPTPSWVDGT